MINKKRICLFTVILLVFSVFVVFKVYPASADGKEFQRLINEAENFNMHILVPSNDFVGKSDKITRDVANQIISDKSAEVDRIFAGDFNASRKELLNYHYSKQIKINCIDGGVKEVNILKTNVDGNSATVTANAKCYVVYREIRDGKKYNFRVNDDGIYTYSFTKDGSLWKISNINGGPDLSKSTNELTLID